VFFKRHVTLPYEINRLYNSKHPMKSKIQIISLTAFVGVVLMTGCAGPEARHDARVDRRHDAGERIEDRSDTRQYNRVDRRDERYDRRGDRRDARYSY
jgi:hypothetical protein